MSSFAKKDPTYDPAAGGTSSRPPTRDDEKKDGVQVTVRVRSPSQGSLALRTPRTARFAEATTVHSPIEVSKNSRNPFADPPGVMTTHYRPEAQPSDVGFGYIQGGSSQATPYTVALEENQSGFHFPQSPMTPLKSALKSPGAPARDLGAVLSPTFREEQILEKSEKATEKENARDVKSKMRVRMDKFVLRGVNFSCSLIVLSMLSATFQIFNATKSLPPRNALPPWAAGTNPWPQITLLVIACISLFMSMVIFYGYWKGGHKRAEKAAVYYTVFSVAFFAFSVIMWGIGAGVLQGAKANSNGQDIWGWSCKDNTRKDLFQQDVNYDLVCRLQDWSLVCCIIEVVVEVITIAIYGITFYRFYSKHRLRKSMDVRDKARNDLYLAHLRAQSAPNTPGFAPMTPGYGPFTPGSRTPGYQMDAYSSAEQGLASPKFVTEQNISMSTQKPFMLQPPPIRVQQATPRPAQEGFDAPPMSPPIAPGEQVYEAVPIPGAYSVHPGHQPGQAITTDDRVASPPTSPRLPLH